MKIRKLDFYIHKGEAKIPPRNFRPEIMPVGERDFHQHLVLEYLDNTCVETAETTLLVSVTEMCLKISRAKVLQTT